ncbi:MAG: 3(2),5-bisphosphate nucleotidase [Gemmatimonadetes bacterium]|nr:3(2),5-bisphosphate nucleotidase [Gemmatimonadota bacterium]
MIRTADHPITEPERLAEDLSLALRAVSDAGRALLPAFHAGQEVRYKGPGQPVTDADLMADRMLRDALMGARPDYGWLSEETKDSPERLARSRVWVVDPIDGTNSFVKGIPEWTVCVGLAVDGRAVLGVVYNPATAEMFHAARGMGAFLNGLPIHVSAGERDGAPVAWASRSEMRRGEFDSFDGWRITPLGSAAYKMVKVADAAGDVFVSRGPKSEWDLCGAQVIVEEAGGQVTDARGRPLTYNRPDPNIDGVAATNRTLHARLLAHVATLPGGTTSAG